MKLIIQIILLSLSVALKAQTIITSRYTLYHGNDTINVEQIDTFIISEAGFKYKNKVFKPTKIFENNDFKRLKFNNDDYISINYKSRFIVIKGNNKNVIYKIESLQ